MAEFTTLEQAMLTQNLSDQEKMLFQSQYASEKKDPTTVLILSVLFGTLGVDRFMLGDMGMGLLKLFTAGLCGILWLIDIFTTKGRADTYNRNKAQEIMNTIQMTSKMGNKQQ